MSRSYRSASAPPTPPLGTHDSRSMSSLAPNLPPTSDPSPLNFSFGGAHFEVSPAPDLQWVLGEEHRRFTGPVDAPLDLRVHCAVSSARELAAEHGRGIRWRWNGDESRVATARARADLRDLGDRRFVATALVSPDANGCSSLCTALAGAITFRVGGLVLHASGIELDGGAVLFIGPSGAGKTTAANHCPGATWFARDRAAIRPTDAGWVASALCGGDPIHLPRAEARTLPLRAVLRVQRGAEAHRLARLTASEALVFVRESVQANEAGPDEEAGLIDRGLQLQHDVLIGALHSVLGSDLTPALRRFLEEQGV